MRQSAAVRTLLISWLLALALYSSVTGPRAAMAAEFSCLPHEDTDCLNALIAGEIEVGDYIKFVALLQEKQREIDECMGTKRGWVTADGRSMLPVIPLSVLLNSPGGDLDEACGLAG
jgi:hypothetical protein